MAMARISVGLPASSRRRVAAQLAQRPPDAPSIGKKTCASPPVPISRHDAGRPPPTKRPGVRPGRGNSSPALGIAITGGTGSGRSRTAPAGAAPCSGRRTRRSRMPPTCSTLQTCFSIQRLDDVAHFAALFGQLDADRAAIHPRTLVIQEAHLDQLLRGCRKRWSRDSSRACATRRLSALSRRCCTRNKRLHRVDVGPAAPVELVLDDVEAAADAAAPPASRPRDRADGWPPCRRLRAQPLSKLLFNHDALFELDFLFVGSNEILFSPFHERRLGRCDLLSSKQHDKKPVYFPA